MAAGADAAEGGRTGRSTACRRCRDAAFGTGAPLDSAKRIKARAQLRNRIGVFLRLRGQARDLTFERVEPDQDIGHRSGRRGCRSRGAGLRPGNLCFEEAAIAAGEDLALQCAHFTLDLAQACFRARILRQYRRARARNCCECEACGEYPASSAGHGGLAPVLYAAMLCRQKLAASTRTLAEYPCGNLP